MSLTIIGAILSLVISFYFIKDMLIIKKKKLLHLCYFFVPFSGVSLFNIPAIMFYVLPFTLTVAVWILSELLFALRKKSDMSINLNNAALILFLIFLIAVLLSSFAPIFINWSDGYMGANDDSDKYFPIKLSSIHLLQLCYIFGGVLFSIFVIGNLNTVGKIEVILRVVIISGVITCIIGIVELAAFYLGLDYNTGWYHTVPTGSADAKGIRIDGLLGIARINSVSYETSNFAQHILVVHAFIYYCRAKKIVIFSKRKDKMVSFLTGFSLIACISSTAIFGLAFINVMYWAISSWTVKKFFSFFVGMSFLTVVLYLAYTQVAIFASVADAFALDKFSGGSAISRFSSIVNAYDIFLRHPIIGVGIGVLPATDLVVMLLSGIGIFGFMIFLLLVLVIIFNGSRKSITTNAVLDLNINARKYSFYRFSVITNALTFSLVVLLFIYQGTGFAFRFGDFWALSALVVSCYLVRERVASDYLATLHK